MATAQLAPAAPREIRRALARIGGRLRTVEAFRGVGTVAAVGAVGAVLGMAVDFLWALPMSARWGIWGAWLAITGLVALFGVVRPLVRRYAADDLAALAERGQPELEERLVGSVALLSGGERVHGSRALIDALAGQAAERARSIAPGRAVPAGSAARRLMAGVAIAGLVALPPLLRPDPYGTLARRFFAPWLELDRVGMVVLEVMPGDAVVAIGSDLPVRAKVAPRLGIGLGTTLPDAAWLEWDDATTGATRRVRMATKDTDSSRDGKLFEGEIPQVSGPVRYRVTTLPIASRRFDVKAVAPPTITSITALVEPPAYTKLPAGPARDPSRLEVVEGSTIAFTIVPSRSVASVGLGWPIFDETCAFSETLEALPGPLRVVAEESGSYIYTTQARRDEYGLDGPIDTHRLRIRPDAAPTLVVRPVEAKETNPGDVLSVPVAARDDFGVASAELHFTIRRAGSEGIEPAPARRDLALKGLGTPHASGEATLALGSLELSPGDVLTYKVRVADNRPAPKGPNVTWSAEGTLAIVAKAEPILARQDRMRRERVQERIEEIKKENLANKQETTQLRYVADTARRTPAAWDKEREQSLAERGGVARKVIDDLNALAGDLRDDPAFHALARPAKEIAEVEAEAGRAALDKAAAAPDAPARLAELRGADARLGAVHQRLEDLQRQFDALAKADAERQKLRELAAKEDALADKAAQAGADPNALAGLRDEQEGVRREFDALANAAPDLKAGKLEAQAREAASLAQKARDLAARQREEARKTGAEGPKRDAALKALAEEQRKLEVDARKLALEVDAPLVENARSQVDPRPLREAVVPIERGEIEQGRRRLEEGEAMLRRVARDIEDAPADPKALVQRLVRRQTELARQVAETVRDAKGKNNPSAKEQAALAEAIKPLAEEEAAILKLAEAIKVDEPRKGAARDAAQAVGRALDNLRNVRPREAEGRQEEARQAFNRLAEALPDHWRREEPARKALEEARRLSDEVARDLDRDLRETAPESGKAPDPARAAAELSRRLEPLAKKESEAAARLAAMDVPARMEPQRRRAEGRARTLAETIERLRKEAVPLAGVTTGLAPIKEWQVVGPFQKDERTPFSTRDPIKKDAKFKGVKGQVAWKPAKGSDDHGKVDLGAIYGRDDNRTAFGYAELTSPAAGVARFAIGSDDTLTVWINGKQVFNVDGSRSYSPASDRFEAALAKGVNRVVIRCGNGNGEWYFGVEVAPPTPMQPELARVEAIRKALPQVAAETRAAMDRLQQKLYGQAPADDVAEELAAEAKELAQAAAKPEAQADPEARREAAAEQHRLATAMRGLPLPDAAALRAEAARLAEDAARALDAPEASAAPAVAKAAEAAKALSDRLAGRLAPRDEARALAEAEKTLAASNPAAQAEQARALATATARLEIRPPADPAARPSPSQGAAEAAAHVADLAERAARPASNDPNHPQPTPADLANARTEAAARLEALARHLSDKTAGEAPPRERTLPDAPRDPELDPLRARADEAKTLALRERRIRERLQAVLGERIPQQEELRQEAAALGREVAELRDQSREPSPSGRGHADAAAELLNNHANRAMNQAIGELAQGRPDPARDDQRQAAEFVERAGQAAEDLARGLLADRPAQADPADLAPARDALAEARHELAGEGQHEGQGQGHAASAAMQRAAQAMRSAAHPGQGQLGDPADVASDGPTTAPRSMPAGVADADLSELQAMVRQKTGRTWGELPGHLRTEILQLSQGKYRDDYARVIQLYFKEIAADGAKPDRK